MRAISSDESVKDVGAGRFVPRFSSPHGGTEGLMKSQAGARIVAITMDRASESVVITRSDHMETRFELAPSPFEATSVMASYRYSPIDGTLLATTQAGDEVLFEMPTLDSLAPLGRRLCVYLDQNQWRTIANVRYGIGPASAEDRRAVGQLEEWVQAQRIVLPASAGHYAETTKWGDTSLRYLAGLTVLQLSRGWQMRDPLQVRREELRMAFRELVAPGSAGPVTDIFTLEPDALHASRLAPAPDLLATPVPPEFVLMHHALTSSTALIDVMLDTEPIDRVADPGWTRWNQEFSDWLHLQDRDSLQKRKSIDVLVLTDLQQDIAAEAHASGVTAAQFHDWIVNGGFQSSMTTMKQLGLFREMLYDRHIAGAKWESNDLTDMVYLSCAAGYADAVICERHMGGVLRQSLARLGQPPHIFRKLPEAIPYLAARLAETSSAQ